MKRNSIFTIVTVLVFALLILCPVEAMAQETVKIGFVGDFTGPAFKMTKDAEQAAILPIEKINSQGGILGRKVEMITRDGGNRPELHARLLHEIISQEKVTAIFGGAASSCVLGASAVAKELKIPYLVSVGNSSAIVWEKGHRYVFLFEPNSVMEANAWVPWAAKQPWRVYSWIGPDYEWSRTTLETFKKKMAERGIQLKFEKELWHKLGETTFTSYIPILKASRPEVLFIGTWGASANAFLLQAGSAGLFKGMKAFGVIGEDTCIALGDKMPEGLYGFSRGAFNYYSAKSAAGKEFTDKYYEKFKMYPGGFSFCANDSVIAWEAAVKKAGSFEAEKVADALRGLKFSGPRGEQYIRAIDGQLSCETTIGPLVYNKNFGFAVLDPANAIPAEEAWLSIDEVNAIRSKQ
jgi:branched-chain amino acid transport system substrate-binding protein